MSLPYMSSESATFIWQPYVSMYTVGRGIARSDVSLMD